MATPLPLGPYAGTVKSVESAIAAPVPSFAVTMHEINSLTRTYVVAMFSCPTHDMVDDTVADVTLNDKGLFRILAPELNSFSVTKNGVVAAAGAVTKKENEKPALGVTSAGRPEPLGPYIGTLKSVESPVVIPTPSLTVTVHDIFSLIRTIVVDVLV